jgi:hypothetical protein
MTYAFIQDVPAGERIYREVRAGLGQEAPKGLISHVAIKKRGGGLRYVDVWETQADWQRFRDEVVEPTVGAVLASHGIPHDHSLVVFEDIEVIDAWVGEVPVTAQP